MTEITVLKSILNPKPRPTLFSLDPVALPLALIGGPILVTLMSFFLLIPVGALIIGGPLYMLLGWPVCLIWFRRHKVSAGAMCALAFFVMMATALLIGAFAAITGQTEHIDDAGTIAILSLLFAVIWGAMSGSLYTCFCRPQYANSHY